MKYNDIQIENLIATAQDAGAAIMEIYARDFKVEVKGDESPLTEADTRSNEIIISRKLQAHLSGYSLHQRGDQANSF
jgi:3'-phosphoadenosine 5'-phosphosulfate (PAPS) 3'-phosphatase